MSTDGSVNITVSQQDLILSHGAMVQLQKILAGRCWFIYGDGYKLNHWLLRYRYICYHGPGTVAICPIIGSLSVNSNSVCLGNSSNFTITGLTDMVLLMDCKLYPLELQL